jgi:hypothetical protein
MFKRLSLFTLLFLTTFLSTSWAQNCYTPLTGQNVQVGTVGNDGILCVTQLCIGSGFSELQKVIDNDVTSGASYSNLGSFLNYKGVSVKKHGGTFPAGYIAGYLFSSQSLVNVGILSNITVATYRNGVLQESKSAGNLLTANILNAGEQKFYLTFKTTRSFDEVRLTTSGISVDFLQGIKVYSAFAFDPTGCAPSNVTSCNRPIAGPTTNVSYDGPGVCASCSLGNPERLNDGDANNYANLYTIASILSSPTVGVINTGAVYPAGYNAGFVVSPSNNNNLSLISFFNTITVETYLFGDKQESSTMTNGSNGALLSAKFLGYSADQKNKVGFKTTKPFNEVRFKQNQAGNISLGSTKIYYAYAEPGNCVECKTYLGSAPSGKYSGNLVANYNGFFGIGAVTYNGTYGIALHSISAINNITSVSKTDFATYYGPLIAGLLSGAKFTVTNNGTLFPAGTTAGFDIAQQGGLFDVSVLNSVIIRTYVVNGSSVQLQEQKVGNVQLLGLDVIGGNTDKSAVGFKTTKPFNAIQIDLNSGIANLGLGSATKIFGAFVFEDADGDGYGDCEDVCPNGNDGIDTDNDGIPDGCDQCNAGNVAPYVGNTALSNVCANNETTVALPLAPLTGTIPAGTVFEWYKSSTFTPANRLTPAQASNINQSGTYYAVIRSISTQVAQCFSPATAVQVTIKDCSTPDLTPNFVYGKSALGQAPSTMALAVSNVGFGATTGQVEFYIHQDPSNNPYLIDVNYDGSANSIVVAGNTITLNNNDWVFTQNPVTQRISLVSKPGVVIAGQSQVIVGFTIKWNENNYGDGITLKAEVPNGTGGEIGFANNTDFLPLIYSNANIASGKVTISPVVNIYPNPTNGTVNITNLKGDETITVMDLSGRKLASYTSNGAAYTINLSSYAQGIYLIDVLSPNGERTVNKVQKLD